MDETATEPLAARRARVGEDPGEDLRAPERYLNRELSWLQFNHRVLQIAEHEGTPLLERLKFCAIFASNLDEFFMVRVAGLHDQIDAGIDAPGQDGLNPAETLEAVHATTLPLCDRVSLLLHDTLIPALAAHGIRIVGYDDVDEDQQRALDERFDAQIFPVLTPLAVGLGRPFPYISNLSLSLAVRVRDPVTRIETFARVKVPKEMLPRFMAVDGGRTFVPMEDVIAHNLDRLFPGMEIVTYDMFRVTRDADFDVSDEADDLLRAVEDELRRRRFGEVVRLEVGAAMEAGLRRRLTDALATEVCDVYEVKGLIDLQDLWQVVRVPGLPEERYPAWQPVTQPRLQSDEAVAGSSDVMAAMREGEILLHHPYDSFSTSVQRLVEQAVADPAVLAIKQTVYRTSDDSPLVPALIDAAEKGKQAVCLVELKARFDERANIRWARSLEESGVHVVYGHPSLKTHAKCLLIVRREGDGVRHYVHVGTGNYNATTARIYADLGLLTCDPAIGADVADMFNFLTGYARPPASRAALLAPQHLRDAVIAEIERTSDAHEQGRPTRIRMKMNALVDGRCIRALYRASRAGVPIELNVRGICCLRPGVPGLSETIRVVSIVGRFLEHSRIFAFERDGEHTVYMGSADLMPRNLDQRVELVVPVADPDLRGDLLDVLDRYLADDVDAWELDADGNWHRRARPAGAEPRSAQRELMGRHGARAAEGAVTT